MFRKLIILLGLLVAPAFAQEVTYTDPTQIPTVEQTYTFTQQETATPIQDVNDQGGSALTLYDDGVSQAISLGFDFYFYGNLYDSVYISQNGFISFTNNANGCCNGQPLPYFTEWTEQNASYYQYYSVNNSIFAMWSDLADFNAPGNPYYKVTGNSFVVGWYGVDELNSAPYTCDEMGCYSSGLGNKFTFEISLFSDSSFSINYGAFDYNNQTGRMFTAGYQGDQEGEYYQIYNGNDPSSLQNTTYFVQSSEIIAISDTPVAPDCTINPYDPTCIINDLFDDEEIYFADEETGSDNGSDDGSEYAEEEEELLADEEMTDEEWNEMLEELLADEDLSDEDLEELLADLEEDDSAIGESERIVANRELSDEEKAAILADAISKTTLESALSIAADATTSTSTAASNAEGSSTSTRSSNESSGSASNVSHESTLLTDSKGEQNTETATSDNALDIFETGRVLGQEALATTMAATEASASDSISQAESVAQTSSFESMGSPSSTVETINSIEIENVIETVAAAESNTDTSMEMMGMSEPTTETGNVSDGSEIFVSVENNPFAASAQEAEDVALSVVNNSITSSEQKTFEDEANTDAEVTSAMIDPALAVANTFNQAPSMMSLDFLGVLKPIEEKSDAELRAEQVVAANKEEQDAINANYMDADQSGIVAAIGADADVSSYLSTRLADNNTWYKPEDIYKGVVIKDNARGSYFLEKGNTDTYKKMVDEQYK